MGTAHLLGDLWEADCDPPVCRGLRDDQIHLGEGTQAGASTEHARPPPTHGGRPQPLDYGLENRRFGVSLTACGKRFAFLAACAAYARTHIHTHTSHLRGCLPTSESADARGRIARSPGPCVVRKIACARAIEVWVWASLAASGSGLCEEANSGGPGPMWRSNGTRLGRPSPSEFHNDTSPTIAEP